MQLQLHQHTMMVHGAHGQNSSEFCETGTDTDLYLAPKRKKKEKKNQNSASDHQLICPK